MQKRSKIREVEERQEEDRRHIENDDVEIEGHFNTEENSHENSGPAAYAPRQSPYRSGELE